MVGKNLHYIHKYLSEHKFKVKKETIKFTKEVLSAFEMTYKFYYEPTNNNYKINREALDSLIDEASDFISKNATPNSVLFFRLAETTRIIATMNPKIETVNTFLETKYLDS